MSSFIDALKVAGPGGEIREVPAGTFQPEEQWIRLPDLENSGDSELSSICLQNILEGEWEARRARRSVYVGYLADSDPDAADMSPAANRRYANPLCVHYVYADVEGCEAVMPMKRLRRHVKFVEEREGE